MTNIKNIEALFERLKTNCFDKITFQEIYVLSGKSQCSSICNADFDCQWGQVCENGICANNEEIHWKCNGIFNDPHESCDRYNGGYLHNNETQGIILLKNFQSKSSLTYMGLKQTL